MRLTTQQEVLLIVLAVIGQRAARSGWAVGGQDGMMMAISGAVILALVGFSYLYLRR